jgi:UDP-N-acetylmuramoylalanine--D-glutamate ligase
MTPATTFAGRKVAVFGLGRSGLAAARALIAGGAAPTAWDDHAPSREAARALNLPVADLASSDWSAFAALVLAPGVPLTHPSPHWCVLKAQQAGVPIIGDIEVFCRERAHLSPAAPLVAITGTNGKSTTTALIGHLLGTAGREVAIGGNIGTAILDLAPPAARRVHVVEMSSFQIELTPSLNPTIGILLNISPDHLDRHGSMERYAGLKARVVEAALHPIVGDDDDWCRDIGERLRLANRTWLDIISARSRVGHGWYALDAELIARAPWTGPLGAFADLTGIGSLRGRHNIENALAASAAAMHLGLAPAQIAAGLRSFAGLPHRLEQVGRLGRTLFINDSKATNAQSAATALGAFERDIFVILGGKPKAGGIDSLAPYFARISKAFLIGEATEAFAAALTDKVAFVRCGTLDVAVAAAAAAAARLGHGEPVVLLSPACASYDQFVNFEVRGDAFRALVAAIPGIVMGNGAPAGQDQPRGTVSWAAP